MTICEKCNGEYYKLDEIIPMSFLGPNMVVRSYTPFKEVKSNDNTIIIGIKYRLMSQRELFHIKYNEIDNQTGVQDSSVPVLNSKED